MLHKKYHCSSPLCWAQIAQLTRPVSGSKHLSQSCCYCCLRDCLTLPVWYISTRIYSLSCLIGWVQVTWSCLSCKVGWKCEFLLVSWIAVESRKETLQMQMSLDKWWALKTNKNQAKEQPLKCLLRLLKPPSFHCTILPSGKSKANNPLRYKCKTLLSIKVNK